jgi:hypothetical protein
MNDLQCNHGHQVPWNKGKQVGQKSPLKLKQVCAIRIRLQFADNVRDLALFNLAIDSKLESTVRYLGIEVDDALEMAEQTEV